MHLPQLWFIVVLTSHGGGRRIGPPRLVRSARPGSMIAAAVRSVGGT